MEGVREEARWEPAWGFCFSSFFFFFGGAGVAGKSRSETRTRARGWTGASGAGAHISAAECHDGAVEAFLVFRSREEIRGVLFGTDVAKVEAARGSMTQMR